MQGNDRDAGTAATDSHCEMDSGEHPPAAPSAAERARVAAAVAEGFLTIRADHFGVNGRPPLYDDKDFRRRFFLPRPSFVVIYEDIKTEQ